MGNAILDALGYVGGALDKPGRAVRGLLAGQPREALAAVPFSDALGLTDESERVSGRALLESLGVLGPKGDPEGGFDAGDAAGLAAEVATDPLNFLGAGAAGAAGLKTLERSKALAAVKAFKAPTGFPAEAVEVLAGRAARPLPLSVAAEHYAPWAASLTDPERDALKLWTTGSGAERINHAARGGTLTAGGHPYDPFEFAKYNPAGPKTAEEALATTLPALDAALAKGAAPADVLAYRRAGRLPGDPPAVGGSVADPGYLATSLDSGPVGFYGRRTAVEPGNTLMDVVVPKGAPGGYIPAVGRSDEGELLLPRGGNYEVLAKRDLPLTGVRRRGEEAVDYFRPGPDLPDQVAQHVTKFAPFGTPRFDEHFETLAATQPSYLVMAADPAEGVLARTLRRRDLALPLAGGLAAHNALARGR